MEPAESSTLFPRLNRNREPAEPSTLFPRCKVNNEPAEPSIYMLLPRLLIVTCN